MKINLATDGPKPMKQGGIFNLFFLINFLGPNTIKRFYQEYFNTNDVFNHYLYKRYHPIEQRSGWQSNYTDFILAAYQMNLFTLYHELKRKIDHKKRKEFTEKLYKEIMEIVRKVENRRPKVSNDDDY